MIINAFFGTELKLSEMLSAPLSAPIQSVPKNVLITRKHSNRNKKRLPHVLRILRNAVKMPHAAPKRINLV
jgi:hypothetical protein